MTEPICSRDAYVLMAVIAKYGERDGLVSRVRLSFHDRMAVMADGILVIEDYPDERGLVLEYKRSPTVIDGEVIEATPMLIGGESPPP